MASIGAIAAMTRNRVIGLHNDIPWRYPADWARFKQVTLGGSIIMGRKTWESIGSKPLPKRQNIVITRSKLNGVSCAGSIEQSLALAEREAVWFIGGGKVYAQALPYCDFLDITWVPDEITADGVIHFPNIPADLWLASDEKPLAGDPSLMTQRFSKLHPT